MRPVSSRAGGSGWRQRRVFQYVCGVAAVAMTLLLGSAPATYAQSTAADGSIEGTITDNSGAALPAVSVTITNDGTGVSRTIVSNDRALYRVPLLPLGT